MNISYISLTAVIDVSRDVSSIDIDECASNPCDENCTQTTPGPGYTCTCEAGKMLDVDNRTCIGTTLLDKF